MYKLLHCLHPNANEVDRVGKTECDSDIKIIHDGYEFGFGLALESR